MSDKIYFGQDRTAREVNKAFSGAFGEYRADVDQVISATSGDTTYWNDAVAPRENTLGFWNSGTPNRFTALDNWHLIGAMNIRLTWNTPPTAGDTVKVSIVSDYSTPDDWIAECEIPVGNQSLAMSIAIGEFIPKASYWEVLVINNTDQDVTFNGKIMLHRVG